MMVPEVRVVRVIASSPDGLYDMVSDVTRMGRWSPETTSCRWLGPDSRAVAGARFKGANRRGWRRWSTTCKVVSAEPGRRFAFDVDFGPLPVSRWSYDFEADGPRCRVTETWLDRRPGWMVRLSPAVMGVGDQQTHNRDGMEATLASLAQAAEAAP